MAAILRTHAHHHHVVHEDELRERYGVELIAAPGAWAFGDLRVRGLATPGHSDDMVAFHVGDLVTGVWSGNEPEGTKRVRFGGRDATLIVWSPDYDGKGKA